MQGTYVLVHGAWHTCAEIEPAAEVIRQQGHTVFCPTLAGNRPGDNPMTTGLEDAASSRCDYLRTQDPGGDLPLGTAPGNPLR